MSRRRWRAAPLSLSVFLLEAAHATACRPPPVLESLPGSAAPARPEPPVVDGADGNDSLATAVPLTLDDELGVGDAFERPDDVDTFVVEVPDARVIEVRVLGNVTGWGGAPNPRLALRDEAGTLLVANNDDPLQAAVGGDPRAVVHFGPGALYVEVTEAQGLGDGSFGYTVLAATATRGLELEPNDTREQATDLEGTFGFSSVGDPDEEFVGVTVTATGDADWFRLPVASADTRFFLTLSRRTTTSVNAAFTVHDASGAIIARGVPRDLADEDARAVVWPTGSDMFVQMTSDAAPQAILLRAVPSQRRTEQEDRGVAGQNDELATAEELSDSFPMVFTSDLSAAGDVDRFLTPTGGDYSVACSSAIHGSGVLGFTIEARDDTDTVLLGPEVEDDSGSPVSLRVDHAAPFQFRMSKQGQDAENLGGTVNCTFFRFD